MTIICFGVNVCDKCFLFLQLKGLNSKQSREEAAKMLAVLQLTDKSSALAKNLSGGMRRKLSVGLALCAGSKVIICILTIAYEPHFVSISAFM